MQDALNYHLIHLLSCRIPYICPEYLELSKPEGERRDQPSPNGVKPLYHA